MPQSQRMDQKLSYVEGPEYVPPVGCFRDMFDNVLVQHGDQPALISLEQHDDSSFTCASKVDVTQDCLRYTFRELNQYATLLAISLYSQGLCPQQTLATLLPNSAEFSIALLAAAILNVPLVPLDPRSLTRPAEIQHQLKTINPVALLVSDEQRAESLDRLEGTGIPKSCLKILISGASTAVPGWLCLKELFMRVEQKNMSTPIVPEFKAVDVEDDIALMIFTSGTSGLPKACRLTSMSSYLQECSLPCENS